MRKPMVRWAVPTDKTIFLLKFSTLRHIVDRQIMRSLIELIDR